MPRTPEQIERLTPRLQPHQERVIHEHADLAAKCAALDAFLTSDKAKGIEPEELERLKAQLKAMTAYRNVLVQRIVNFKPPEQIPLPPDEEKAKAKEARAAERKEMKA